MQAHNRQSIRLKGYDYSQEGLYFVTICVQNRECIFGEIINHEMILNDAGKMAFQSWSDIPNHFPNVVLHEFVVMPNHIHGMIEIIGNDKNKMDTNVEPSDVRTDVGAKNFSPLLRRPQPKPTGTSRTIGSMIRGFKIGVTKQIGYSVWQRNYYEHIIRNHQSYERIIDYIVHNPQKWDNDKFYPQH
jgi:REP element-mobilizing transposase RayT